MTLAQYERAYASRSGLSVRTLHRAGRYAAPCACGEGICEGFQMLHLRDGPRVARLKAKAVYWLRRLEEALFDA